MEVFVNLNWTSQKHLQTACCLWVYKRLYPVELVNRTLYCLLVIMVVQKFFLQKSAEKKNVEANCTLDGMYCNQWGDLNRNGSDCDCYSVSCQLLFVFMLQ